MLGAKGVIAIETSVAAVTVNVTAVDVMEPEMAVMVVVPGLMDTAEPLDPEALLIEATEPDEDTQVTDIVRF
jgi:hypothetical protein